jgi:hypothetical protein
MPLQSAFGISALGWSLIAASGLLAQTGSPSGPAPDIRAELTGELTELPAFGAPGAVVAIGPRSAVIATSRDRRTGVEVPVVAAAEHGKGRIVIFGHGGYTTIRKGSDPRAKSFLLRCLRWAGRSDEPVVHASRGFANWAASEGLQARSSDKPGQGTVLVVTDPGHWSAARTQELLRFVESGGGLIFGATPWGWLQLNPGKKLLEDHAGQQLLRACGLGFSSGMARAEALPAGGNGYRLDRPVSAYAHAGHALERLTGKQQLAPKDAAQLESSLRALFDVLPPDSKQLRALADGLGEVPVPSPKRPLRQADVRGRLAVQFAHQRMRKLPLDQRAAHPSAKHFPGSIGEGASEITRNIEVPAGHTGWHSTGLYAPAGAVIRVRSSSPRSAKSILPGLQLRIGCHTDKIWHQRDWKRWPDISSATTLAPKGETRVASAFGGLVYIDMGRGLRAPATIRIQGAIAAPHFVLGQTSVANWKEMQRSPAPWGEIEGERLVLSLPTEALRACENPAEVARFWDEIVRAHENLLGEPIAARRKERFVPDVQISLGYMHSGYPIMTHLDVVPLSTDVAKLRKEGSWGHFHELGHNAQRGMWTFGGTVEVTCNLFVLHALERLTGEKPIDNVRMQRSWRTVRQYLKQPDFEQWKRKPFLALCHYVEILDAFGWQPLQDVFAEYRQLPRNERPRSDADKRDQWCLRLSRRIGHNLAPYFAEWGIPLRTSVAKQLADLPTWHPKRQRN